MRKRTLRFALFGLFLGMLASTVSALAASVSDGGPVRLLYTTSGSYRESSASYGNTYIRAHAKSIGSSASRAVYAHVRYVSSSSTWETLAMSKVFEDANHATYELSLPYESVEFVLEYVTDVGTFWDNNNWVNYPTIACYFYCDGSEEMFVGGNVGLVTASLRAHREGYGSGTTQLYGELTVNIEIENLNYNKRVGARATYDNGATWFDVNGVYQGGESTGVGITNSIEHWRVNTDRFIPSGISQVRLALYYYDIDGGAAYWDNNFAQDYRLAVFEGSTTSIQ